MGWIGRGCVVGLLALSVPAGTLACGDRRGGCGNIDCGGGLSVWWAPGDVADAASYRLCVDDRCEAVEPTTGIGSRDTLYVGASATQTELDVRLELLDARGEVAEVLAGGGTRTGECCRSLELRAGDGRLRPESIPH